jgi:hypothetical protein
VFFEVVDSVVELRDPSSAAPSTKPGHSYAQFLIKLNSFSFTSKRLKIRFSLQSPSEANDTKDSLETKQIIHERQKCHNPGDSWPRFFAFLELHVLGLLEKHLRQSSPTTSNESDSRLRFVWEASGVFVMFPTPLARFFQYPAVPTSKFRWYIYLSNLILSILMKYIFFII